jgi:mannosyltransferase OCH1-like enzyme
MSNPNLYLIFIAVVIITLVLCYYNYKHVYQTEPYDVDEMNVLNMSLIERTAGANSVGDDRIYLNGMKDNEKRGNNYTEPTQKEAQTIPLKIFQTWHSKDLPPEMKKCVYSLKKSNPEFEYYLFDDDDCREFIKNHFSEPVLKAFDKLKPGAFKADLWRCCILYVYGGIYLDIKFCCVDGFKFITLTNDEYFVRDYGSDWAVYNALMICKPNNYILLNCIKQIVQNVETEYYGTSPLEVTGPKMMIKFFTPKEKRNLNRLSLKAVGNDLYIVDANNKIILKNYSKYKVERQKFQLNHHYSVLWSSRDIYVVK